MAGSFAQCDIVVPVYGQAAYTKGCVDSIRTHTTVPFRLIIVDDASVETATIEYLKELSVREARVRVLRQDQNRGYVDAVNLGLKNTAAEFVVVMNNDTVVYPGWLEEMIVVAGQDPQIGIVNPEWEVPREFGSDTARYVKQDISARHGEFMETDWARGFCYLTKRCVIDRIGGLDRDFAPAYYDDWDYSLRAAAAGYRCARALGAFVYHFRNVTYSTNSSGQTSALLQQKGQVFYKRWGKPLNLLVIDDGRSPDIEEKILVLLRDQNRVMVISPRVGLRHTNLKVIRVPRWLSGLASAVVLLDDARHSPRKRFHLVIRDFRAVERTIKELKFGP